MDNSDKWNLLFQNAYKIHTKNMKIELLVRGIFVPDILQFFVVMGKLIDFFVIARNLKRHRKKLGLTQEQFAELVGVSTEYVSKIETAVKHPSLKLLDKCAEIYSIDVSEFLSGVSTKSKIYLIPEIYEIIKDFEPETKNMLIKDAECLMDIDCEIKAFKENQKGQPDT